VREWASSQMRRTSSIGVLETTTTVRTSPSAPMQKSVTSSASFNRGTTADGSNAMSALPSMKLLAQRAGGVNKSSARRSPACRIP